MHIATTNSLDVVALVIRPTQWLWLFQSHHEHHQYWTTSPVPNKTPDIKCISSQPTYLIYTLHPFF